MKTTIRKTMLLMHCDDWNIIDRIEAKEGLITISPKELFDITQKSVGFKTAYLNEDEKKFAAEYWELWRNEIKLKNNK